MCGAFSRASSEFQVKYQAYQEQHATIQRLLTQVIDDAGDTAGWKEFIDLAEDVDSLQAAMIEFHSVVRVRVEIEQAVAEIDQAKEKVLDRKFNQLSVEIVKWWNLLRPDEPTFFECLAQRPGTRRSIDFKAGLSPHDDRTKTTVRDVVAVFSQSQLHCLGLAVFIARTVHEGTGLIILDDPFLTSDDEHRIHFSHSVVTELLDANVQVIIFTQDYKIWKDMTNLYAHLDIDTFQIIIESAKDGVRIEKASDNFSAILAKARPYVRNRRPEIRKDAGKKLREAAERFCKELAVKQRRLTGEATAQLSDYDGKNLGELILVIEPYLTEPSHPGKLNTIRDRLNPSSHDDAPPDTGLITAAYGDLVKFKKDYL